MNNSLGVSIVIPVYNQLDFTRRCLESLQKYTPGVETIIVDNASTDGTSAFLATQKDIRVISNIENRGCSGAWNQGVQSASHAWIAVLNNDIIVTPGWLENLLEFAEKNQYDVVSPGIREGELVYELHEYAQQFTCSMSRVVRRGIAAGECFMVHRSVFERIGLFDENFKIGQYEDTDFFRRVRNAGFRMAITGCSFVHHFGSVTRISLKKNKAVRPYAIENRAYYHKKWKLGWGKRLLIRHSNKIRDFIWRNEERILHGHSLKEKLINGMVHYY